MAEGWTQQTVKKRDGSFETVSLPSGMSDSDMEKALAALDGGFSKPKQTDFQTQAASRKQGIEASQARSEAADKEPGAVQKFANKATGGLYGAIEPNIPGAAQIAASALVPGAQFAKGASLATKMMSSGQAALGRILVGSVAAGTTKAAAEGVASGIDEAKSASVYGLFGEGIGVSLGALAKVGGQAFERVVLNAAQKSQQGSNIVSAMETKASQAVEQMVKGRSANVSEAYNAFTERLAAIPKGTGKVGASLGGVGEAVQKLSDNISSDLRSVDPGGLPNLREQPLDALVAIHSRITRLAYGLGEETPQPAREAVKSLAADIRNTITKQMAPEERAVFEASKSITKDGIEWGLSAQLSKLVAKRAISGTVGLVVGAGTHSFTAGAAAALGTEALEQKVAPLVLQHMVSTNKMAFQKAIATAAGDPVTAGRTLQVMSVAMARALPRELKDRIKEMAAPKKDSVVNQEKQ